ncbi:MAG: hypothetical protein GEU86_03345 [Actinophytocola sp.]|nr:hypothetical protein [Actinophytocola sp.]
MTPPDNASGRGDAEAKANGTAAESPPWQRVAKDFDEDSREANTAYLYQDASASGQLSDTPRYDDADRMPHTGDIPVVTGVAAQRLFGHAGPDGGAADAGRSYEQQMTAVKGQDSVSVGADPRGRATPSALRRPGRGPRRASLQVKRIDPWSVLKLSLVLGVAMFLVWLVAVGLLYIVLDGMGVWTKLNGTYQSFISGEGADAVADPLISAGRVFGIAAVVGAVNIVLLSALATVSAFIYNVSADLAGGLEVTLSERE